MQTQLLTDSSGSNRLRGTPGAQFFCRGKVKTRECLQSIAQKR